MTRLSTGGMTWDSAYHAPVLAREVAEVLGHARDVLDGTLGGGGHALALLERGARVVGIDRDPQAIEEARTRLAEYLADGRFAAFNANYAEIDSIPELRGARFDGILLDLGVSSHQLDDERRGFTFRQGAVLDMRMGGDEGATAADFLNSAPESELAWVFREYGDERRSPRLAREVTRRRQTRPFATSDDFVGATPSLRAREFEVRDLGRNVGLASHGDEFVECFEDLRVLVPHVA